MSEIFHKELVLDYNGPVSFEIRKKLIALLREKVDVFVKDKGKQKRCSYIFEELLSNPQEYYKSRKLPDEPILVSLEVVNKERIEVCISNTVYKEDTPSLLERIETVNEGNEDDLRELFRSTISKDSAETMGGGIGLITVKMKNGFTYKFELVEKNKTQNLFCLTTCIEIADR